MTKILLKQARIVNRGRIFEADVLLDKGRIAKIDASIHPSDKVELIDLNGLYLLPGLIDDQVHFREPGLTHKATIATESRAAVAGGVTSFMEMPNTVPQALTQQLLQDKYDIAAATSLANYSFFMGASNDNLEEVLRTDLRQVCGLKVFMGSSTGNMLVDNVNTLEALFSRCPGLIATHCEDEAIIRHNTALWQEQFGEDIPISEHPLIRSREACYTSSSMAVELAKKHGTRLHVLHISTAEETFLFDNSLPLADKKITSEACVHHLHFTSADYEKLGTLIKCNPAIKNISDREAIWKAVMENRIDIIATDHAPHTWEEKQSKYLQAPSGLPLVQHALVLMLQQVHAGRLSIERLVEKMCHAPAECFQVEERGYIEEGYWADLVVVDPEKTWTVAPDNILYKCGWSPLMGATLRGKVEYTLVNGELVWDGNKICEAGSGMRLTFNR